MRRGSIFISYSHKDRDVILHLVQGQKDLNDSTFVDVLHTPAGENWEEYHLAAIQMADRFVLCWSTHAVCSHPMEQEWRAALDARVKIIPVLLDDTPLPDCLKHLHAVSLRQYIGSRKFLIYHPHLATGVRSGLCGAVMLGFGLACVVLATMSGSAESLPIRQSVLVPVGVVYGAGGMFLVLRWYRWSRLYNKVTRLVIDELKRWETSATTH